MKTFDPLKLRCPKCGNTVPSCIGNDTKKNQEGEIVFCFDEMTKRFSIKLVEVEEVEQGILHHNSLLEPDEPIEELVIEAITQSRILATCKLCNFSQLFHTADHTGEQK